jgi:hypothetical protein
VEFQLKRDDQARAGMGERIAGYIMRLYEREHLPITSVVIYLQRIGNIPSPPFLIPGGLGSKATIRCEYEVIKMWELASEPTLTDIITYSEESLEQVRARLELAGDLQ